MQLKGKNWWGPRKPLLFQLQAVGPRSLPSRADCIQDTSGWGGGKAASSRKDAHWRRNTSNIHLLGLPPHTPSSQEPCAAMESLMGPFYRQEDQGPAGQPDSVKPWTGCLGCQHRPACRLASPGSVHLVPVASPCPHAGVSPLSLLPPCGLRMNRTEARPSPALASLPAAGTACLVLAR